MRQLIILIILLSSLNLNATTFNITYSFDTANPFYSIVDKTQFDTLKGSDFIWIVFKPINDTLSYIPFDNRPTFIEHLSADQKALFFVWELERAVVGGELGFANFYYNYKSYYAETIKGLRLIRDTAIIKVLEGVNQVYVSKQKIITQKYKTGDWKYIQKLFGLYDEAFLDKHTGTMKLLENYIRLHADKFVRFKDS